MTYKKKLIEVALPLEDINREAAREKSIRHGHPSTLHLWWARRPLAACRAVLFASLVDDPSECVKDLLADAGKRMAAEKELKARKNAWAELKAIFTKASCGSTMPTLSRQSLSSKRRRLVSGGDLASSSRPSIQPPVRLVLPAGAIWSTSGTNAALFAADCIGMTTRAVLSKTARAKESSLRKLRMATLAASFAC